MRYSVDYACKFCRKPGSVSYEIEIGTETMFRIRDRWIPALACNRCADFRVHASNCTDRIRTVCLTLDATAQQHKAAAESAAREKLSVLTQNLARIVCDHYRVSRVYDDEFVAMLMEKPTQSATICKTYINGIARISRENEMPTFEQQP